MTRRYSLFRRQTARMENLQYGNGALLFHGFSQFFQTRNEAIIIDTKLSGETNAILGYMPYSRNRHASPTGASCIIGEFSVGYGTIRIRGHMSHGSEHDTVFQCNTSRQ
ncbi:hypothetical protein D3C74_441470 [compost metagenome]